MKIVIHKHPAFENDSFVFSLEDFYLDDNSLQKIINGNEYYKLKDSKFADMNLSPNGFEKFDYKNSLRDLVYKENLTGTIYTKKCEIENNCNYSDLLRNVLITLLNNPNTTRNIIRIGDPHNKYYDSLYNRSIDVSCLYSIQYMKDNVNIVFRASDIKEELLADIFIIYKYFIKPVYEDRKCIINFFTTTSQNIFYNHLFIRKIEAL